MERNQLAIASLAGAGILGAIAIGVVLRGPSEPAVPAPQEVPEVQTRAVEKERPAPPAGRDVPTAAASVPEGGYTTTESGLQYHDLVVGQGASPEAGQTVVVEYAGFLESGKLFDSSYKRPDAFSFAIGEGNVIKGWDEGVLSMKVGGKRQLRIPADLAYGDRGAPPVIPAGATLVFDVELKDVKIPPKPQTVADSAFTTTESGLKYHDFVVGTGPEPKAGDQVEVHYSGWLTTGKMFDSSLERDKPIKFPLGQGRVIKGWDEGIASMKEGGKRQLVIPPDIAYGERGRPPVIPPGATLVFEVELVDVP